MQKKKIQTPCNKRFKLRTTLLQGIMLYKCAVGKYPVAVTSILKDSNSIINCYVLAINL